MRILVIAAQAALTFVIVALTMPAVLTFVPAARADSAGPFVALAIAGLTFVAVRVAWPKPRNRR